MTSHIITFATKSTEELAKLQSGLNQTPDLPTNYLWWVIGALTLLVVILVGAAAINKLRRRSSVMAVGWLSVNDPKEVLAILTRAAVRQAQHTIEIYSDNHPGIYHGTLIEIEAEQRLVMALSDIPNFDLDFKEQPALVHLNFRTAPNGAMEHYQFNTKTIDIRFVRQQGWREAQVLMPLPHTLISAQRRNYLRLEPLGEHALKCRLYEVNDFNNNGEEAKELTEGEILDISIGGGQMVLRDLINLKGNVHFVGVIELPMQNLGVDLSSNKLNILMQLVSHDMVTGASGSGTSGSHLIIRVKFAGRYRWVEETFLWDYTSFTQSSFQDLAYWLQVYQRYRIQKDHGLLPSVERPVNAYPSIPPERPVKQDNDD